MSTEHLARLRHLDDNLLETLITATNRLYLDSHDFRVVDASSERRLFLFLIRFFRLKDFSLDGLEDSSLDLKFSALGLHLRPVQSIGLDQFFRLSNHLPLLVVQSDSSYFAFQRFRKTIIFDPQLNKTFVYRPGFFKADSFSLYEIYPSLPAVLKSPFDIVSFSFSTLWAVFLGLLAISLIAMLAKLALPIITQYLTGTAIPALNENAVVAAILPSLLLTISVFTFQYFQALLSVRLETNLDLKLQTAVWERFFKLPIPFITRYESGDALSRMDSISTLRRLLGNQALPLLLSFVFSFIYFIYMLSISWQLTVGAIVVTLLSLIISSFSIYRQAVLQKPIIEQEADLTTFTYESVVGVSQIRSCQVEVSIFQRWIQKVIDISLLTRSFNYWSNFSNIIDQSVQPFGSAVLFAIIVYMLVYNQASEIEYTKLMLSFIPFYAAYSSFNQNMVSVLKTLSSISGQVYVNWRRALPMMSQTLETGFQPNAIRRQINGEVSFNNVAFSYPNSHKSRLFDNFSLNVESGSFVAITGPSGCGKTTLISLLLGFYPVQSGSITFDGIPLKEYSIRDLRKQIGVVMQMTSLPAGSIYDIVNAGRDYSRDDVFAALDLASIKDEINNLPLGLDTVINDNSATISGGQRQRIALARALISTPKLIIMDEATSALDPVSQSVITANLDQLSVTRIVIAHRLSTIKSADKVVVINNGSIVGSGSYSDLQQSGIFADIDVC